MTATSSSVSSLGTAEVPGGQGRQQVDVTRAYPSPFALIGCGVTLMDPAFCDGHAVVDIRASATSPEFPAGSGVTLYFQEIIATGSVSAPGWLVRGDGRFFEGIGANGNMQGMNIAGNRSAIHNSFANDNVGGGITVNGDGNTVDAVQASRNDAGDGISVVGKGNTIANSTAAVDNGAAGIRVDGTGNLITGNNAFRNVLDGIGVSGGTAVSPNVVSSNVSGTSGFGNGGTGIALTGTGSGAGGGAGIKGNITRGNASGWHPGHRQRPQVEEQFERRERRRREPCLPVPDGFRQHQRDPATRSGRCRFPAPTARPSRGCL